MTFLQQKPIRQLQLNGIVLTGLGVELGGLRRQLLAQEEQIFGISTAVLLIFEVFPLQTKPQDLLL